jgi:ABC-type branched-subunit amino acid transport system ATPase component
MASAIFPQVAQRHSQSAGTLSGGEQRMLSIGMAMVMNQGDVVRRTTFGLSPFLQRT